MTAKQVRNLSTWLAGAFVSSLLLVASASLAALG